MKTFEVFLSESWSNKYKKSIDCSNPKGFSQKSPLPRKKIASSRNKNKKYGGKVNG